MKPDEEAMLIALLMKRYGFEDIETVNSTTATRLMEVLDDYVLNVGGHINE